MKLDNSQFVKTIYEQGSNWIDANELANIFNVSSRTVRNYVRNINRNYPKLIISSNKGYKIDQNKYNEFTNYNVNFEDINKERVQYILNQLLLKEEVDVYDLADELTISDSSIEKAILLAKDYLHDFGMKIDRKRNIIRLNGTESSKRQLINKLLSITDDQFVYFSRPFDSSSLIFDIEELTEDIMFIFENYGFYINDYGLNTVLLHIIVMVERVANGNIMENSAHLRSFSTQETEMINELGKYLNNKFDIDLGRDDLYWLSIVIFNNCASTGKAIINQENIDKYIEKEYLDLTDEVLKKLMNNYGLEPFSSDFKVNFAVHLRNLVMRASSRSFTTNPLTHTFKGNYPLIYDMATFITKEIQLKLNITINDDEISFIAFHIGSYIENNNLRKSKINCCFVYAEYHNFHAKSVDKIISRLHSELFISSTISIKNIDKIPSNVDLIISCCSIPDKLLQKPVVNVSLFVSGDDIENIREYVKRIKDQKKKATVLNSLHLFLTKKLFRKDFYLDSNHEMIRYLADECVELGLCNKGYDKEVLDREDLSSTSFSNGIAIPHSLQMSANQSFLSVVVNKKKMKWGDNDVQIIMLIGTSLVDREAFKTLFDELIAVLFEPNNIQQLIKCNTYESFTEKLAAMITEDEN